MSRLAQLEKLHAADPADADLPYMIAQEFAKTGDHEGALAWYDKCIAADANYHYAYFHKAKSLESLERIADAIDTLKQGIPGAKSHRDMKALNELSSYLDELEG